VVDQHHVPSLAEIGDRGVSIGAGDITGALEGLTGFRAQYHGDQDFESTRAVSRFVFSIGRAGAFGPTTGAAPALATATGSVVPAEADLARQAAQIAAQIAALRPNADLTLHSEKKNESPDTESSGSTRPPYHANPARLPGPTMNPNKTPEPGDAAQVYQAAVQADKKTFYGLSQATGEIYRFFTDNAGTAHFSGATGPGGIRLESIPITIRRLLGRLR
jgi:hypothetical protein